jgi:hypothetical protein
MPEGEAVAVCESSQHDYTAYGLRTTTLLTIAGYPSAKQVAVETPTQKVDNDAGWRGDGVSAITPTCLGSFRSSIAEEFAMPLCFRTAASLALALGFDALSGPTVAVAQQAPPLSQTIQRLPMTTSYCQSRL